MKNNNLYLKLDRLKKLPEVQQFSDELIEKHMVFGNNIDMVGLINELLETADYTILSSLDIKE